VKAGAAAIVAVVAVVALAATGCVQRYTGAARPIERSDVVTDQAWVAAPAPEVRQRELADCGPAALAMITARWRVELDRDAIAEALAPIGEHGVKLGALRDVARAHGLRAYAIAGDRATLEHEVARRRPVVVGLRRPHGDRAVSHFEVVVGLHPDGYVATIDPGSGWLVRPWYAFQAEWAAAGHATLVVLPR
jgi:ABC-type bacteriocin/lantibiotic exporter with double-glycine peptidase domain